MNLRSVFILGAAAFYTSPALAQSASDGFYLSGRLQLETYSYANRPDVGFSGNVLFGYGPTGISSAPIGFEIDIEYAQQDFAPGYISQIYGTVFWDANFGRVSLGYPRSVVDSYLPPNPFSEVGIQNQIMSANIRSRVNLAQTSVGGDDPIGIRYDGKIGETMIGLSYHYSDVPKYNLVGLAIRHKFDKVTFSAGVELQHDTIASYENYNFGLEFDLGKLDLAFYHFDGAKANFFNRTGVSAKYQINDALTVGADVLSTSGGSPTWGVHAKYNFWENAYITGGVYETNVPDLLYFAALGWEF